MVLLIWLHEGVGEEERFRTEVSYPRYGRDLGGERMTREDLINQRATTCRHGGHCEWVACDKCNHYEPDNSTSGCSEVMLPECSDCISRQEAINCVTSNEFRYKIVEDIKTLPSVTPKEKTRHKVKEEAKEQTPMEQTLDFFKNLYLQNKEEFDRVARDFKAESEVQK